ncbi:MAG TPA: FtsX-like permease family protein, partial [Blastocatellia bacterium]|nr:FtsX-like permease family protein [Blastocatellia bacterium]
GRFFADSDARVAIPVMRWWPGQPYPARFNEPQPAPAVIINATMARRYWPKQDPVGQRISIIASPWLTIIGVVGDVHHQALDSKPNPEMYLVDLQEPQGAMQVVVRTDGEPMKLAAAVREQVRAIDPGVPVTITALDDMVAGSVLQPRFYTTILGAFGLMALLLAVVGIYGVVSNSVTQRTHEIGVRVALGAQPRDLLRQVVGRGMLPVSAGLVIGIPVALGLTRMLEKLLFEVKPTDPLTFIAFAALLMFVAMIACYIPARRATKVDPIVALRYE